jgi:hypothetical protein
MKKQIGMSEKTRWPNCDHGLPKDQCDLCRPAPSKTNNVSSLVEELRREANINSLCGSQEWTEILNRAAEAIWLADRLSYYIRMMYEAKRLGATEPAAIAWRDYEQERGRSPNTDLIDPPTK